MYTVEYVQLSRVIIIITDDRVSKQSKAKKSRVKKKKKKKRIGLSELLHVKGEKILKTTLFSSSFFV